MDRVAAWWDGLELWVAGLPFVPQVALVLVVMVPVCFGIAQLLDRGLAVAFAALGRGEVVDADGPAHGSRKAEER